MSENRVTPVSEQAAGNSNRGRIVLLFILLVFLSPWIFAMLWNSSGRINHGDLIEPVRPLPDVVLLAEPGVATSVEDFRGKWSWVLLVDERCDDDCVSKLDLLRQVRIAQKKHIKRLRYSLVVVEPTDVESTPLLQPDVMDEHPELTLRFVKRDRHAAFLKQFRDDADATDTAGATIYVIDPLGNVMMKYRSDIDRSTTDGIEGDKAEGVPGLQPQHLHRDMARLLKASQVG